MQVALRGETDPIGSRGWEAAQIGGFEVGLARGWRKTDYRIACCGQVSEMVGQSRCKWDLCAYRRPHFFVMGVMDVSRMCVL
jgi:hypothetical protein